jgi:hypothetical protein
MEELEVSSSIEQIEQLGCSYHSVIAAFKKCVTKLSKTKTLRDCWFVRSHAAFGMERRSK